MVLFRLHVWGPAFGLASIDAESLATIAYLANALQGDQWEIVATSPSGVPTHSLPALHEPGSGTWTPGFTSITARLRALRPDGDWDLDKDLNLTQRADAAAYASFLRSDAAPLVALSLYVSSANWAGTTRPAYGSILPFPLTWSEPLAVRGRMCELADHLGLSDLNVDDDGTQSQTQRQQQQQQASSTATGEATDGFLKVPDRLRPLRRGVKAALSPEQTALFRLEAVANNCLSVLSDLKTAAEMEGASDRSFFSSSPPTITTSLDCLAFGYLALMLAPDVPRPWLRDLIRRRHESLAVFVDTTREALFGGDPFEAPRCFSSSTSTLPWADPSSSSSSSPWALTRFVRGVVASSVPRGWLIRDATTSTTATIQSKSSASPSSSASGAGSSALAALGGGAAVAGILGSALLYRHMPPLGAALYRWEMPRRRAFGAAGALFGL
ncbi:topogenesis of outer membrane beta barrel protein 37 [Diaporthe helianthi]|uniref:Topogenesis of outer membrane beta barrel protein 37 n=1 Tax=Diaporthe helianthi TaxID=158607 RepID=A0A2P5I8R8_DIAHE|nr:topogenesis of outer membrane beta barrel protein 37 [Diaporthe helianthi]